MGSRLRGKDDLGGGGKQLVPIRSCHARSRPPGRQLRGSTKT